MIVGQFRVELRRLLHRGVLTAFLMTGMVVLVLVGVGTYVATGAEVRPYEYYDDEYYDDVVTEVVERTFCPSSLVTSSLVTGPVVDGPVVEEPVTDGPVTDGPLIDGPVTDGPVIDWGDDCPSSTPSVIPRQVDYAGSPAAYFPWNGSIAIFNAAFAVALWVLVAGLVGEEFRHGTVETALVAEPRRARLLTLRFAAVASVAVMAWVVMSAGYLAAIAPSWFLHGIDDTTVPASLLVTAAARGLVVTVLVALLAASLAVIGRGALSAVGALVGLAILTGAFFLFVRALVPVEFFTNAWAVLTGGDGFRAYQVHDPYAPNEVVTRFGAGRPWSVAVAVVVAYTAATVGGAYALFMRRDVR